MTQGPRTARASSAAPGGKHADRIRIEQHRPGGPEDLQRRFAGGVDRRRRRVRSGTPCSASRRAGVPNRRCASSGRTMMLVRAAAYTGNAACGHRNRRQAGARCAPRRAPPFARRPSWDSRRRASAWPRVYLLAEDFVRGNCARHSAGSFSQASMRSDSSTGGGNAYIGDHDFAAQVSAGHQYVARLFAREGDGAGRGHRAHALAACRP